MARYEVDGTSAMAPQEDENHPILRLAKDGMAPDVTGRGNIIPNGSKERDSKIVDFNDAKNKLVGGESAASNELEQGNTKGLDDIRDRESKAK